MDGAGARAVRGHDPCPAPRAWLCWSATAYLIAAVAIGMTVLPRLPGIGEQVNGAYLDVHVGGVSFQPAELAKIAIVIFLASYLRDNRQILVTGRPARAGRNDCRR